MKRLSVFVLSFLVVFGLWTGSAAAQESFESGYGVSSEKTVSIVPTVQIHEPGTILLNISWTAPQLSFTRKARPSDRFGFYDLQSPVTMPFILTNNSRPSSSGAFSGAVSVQAIKKEGALDGAALRRDNIKILLSNDSQSIVLEQGAVDSGSFSLNYANRGDAYLDSYAKENMLADSLTQEEIIRNMTVGVQFVISKAP